MTAPSTSSAVFSSQKMRVLFVEDDDDCREALSAEFGDHGLEVESFRDGRSMLDGIDAELKADVALLDWNLPDISGIDLALELKRRQVAFPYVFLTGKSLGVGHEMLAFERGALDFIDKARGVPIIVKRLRALTGANRQAARIEAIEPEPTMQQGKLTLRPQVSRALWDGNDLDLTLTEYKILALLVATPGRFASYRAHLRLHALCRLHGGRRRRRLPHQRAVGPETHPQQIPGLSARTSPRSRTTPASVIAGEPS